MDWKLGWGKCGIGIGRKGLELKRGGGEKGNSAKVNFANFSHYLFFLFNCLSYYWKINKKIKLFANIQIQYSSNIWTSKCWGYVFVLNVGCLHSISLLYIYVHFLHLNIPPCPFSKSLSLSGQQVNPCAAIPAFVVRGFKGRKFRVENQKPKWRKNR
jgi:hypothetical protein